MLYSFIKPWLFRLDPERAHAMTLQALQRAERLGALSWWRISPCSEPVPLMGLKFPNRVGIAAGLDKNAACIDAWASLGAGVVEVGTVTPRAQPGNATPRIFRLPHAQALINRMGFPNDGMEVIAQRLQQRKRASAATICGVNIGKNASTPLEQAVDDYVKCLHCFAPLADYIAVNVSSPNTVGLRSLQAVQSLRPMLQRLQSERQGLLPMLGKPLPLLVKLAPDLADQELYEIAELLLELKLDGVIATNTTISRPGQLGTLANEAGGLSGRPVHALSLAVVSKLRRYLGPQFPIIGVGGITSAAEALAMRQAGADIVQIYTGLVYRGPELLREVATVLR